MAKIHNIGGQGETPPQQKVQISLKDSTPMLCSECGDDVFISGTKIRKVSKLLTGSPQDMIIPYDVFICGNCGKINEELLPNEVKNLDD